MKNVEDEPIMRDVPDGHTAFKSGANFNDTYSRLFDDNTSHYSKINKLIEEHTFFITSERFRQDLKEEIFTLVTKTFYMKYTEDFFLLFKLYMYDEELFKHSLNVCIMTASVIVSDFPIITEEDKRLMMMGAMFHDIGKCRVPREILNKKCALTTEEYTLMKEHVNHGNKILNQYGEKSSLVHRIVAEHHLKINSYYCPLDPEQTLVICTELSELAVDIVAVCDVFDALTCERPYKKALCREDVFSILEDVTKKDAQLNEIKEILFRNTKLRD